MPSGVRTAGGLTPKMEIFANLLARGLNLSQAYRDAYQSEGNFRTVNQSASRLWAKPEIRARVEGLLQEQSTRMLRDSVSIRRHVLSRLLAESQDMKNKGSERISALIALGKIGSVGMFKEIGSVERLTDRPPEEIERELRAKLDVFLNDPGSKRNGATILVEDGASTEIEAVALPLQGKDQSGTMTVVTGDQGADGRDRDP